MKIQSIIQLFMVMALAFTVVSADKKKESKYRCPCDLMHLTAN